MIITTTHTLQDRTIIEYKGIISAKNVRGINVIRDFLTSFRDFFGGRSGSYQDVMSAMEQELLSELQQQASVMGANAVIGVTIDFDNVGSKGKSLLMAYAKGTAIVTE
ncbi:MAG: YbjQ family protein [Kiritimatiellales bacterium]|nr:YbjQ family protein [Kiritimatiellales bacterium]